MEIKIDPEFKALIPPLSSEEKAQLEKNILAEGCRDALVVWNGILLDGHNRFEICGKHSLPYKTETINGDEIKSRVDARIWIRNNQKGRRNLTPAWMIELELGNKEDLLAKGREKLSESGNKGNDVRWRGESPLSQNDKPDPPPKPHNTQKAIAKAAGVSTGQVGMAEQVRKKAPDLWDKAKSGDVTISAAYTQVKRAEKEEKREERRRENKEKVEKVKSPEEILEVGGKFSTIVIDPPWDWGDEGDVNQLGRAKPDYHTMSIEEIKNLPVANLSDIDCHIYLWITNRSLPKGFALLESWGFRYITALTWVKPHFGMGNYFRGQTEHILFGVKGSQLLKRKDVGTVFHAGRSGGHSSKPVEFYEIVENCSFGPYLEMFSRSSRDGWVAWGENERTD